MKKAKGDVKKLLIVIGELQNHIGRAKAAYDNDRSSNRADKVLRELEIAFNLCINATGEYYPIDGEFLEAKSDD